MIFECDIVHVCRRSRLGAWIEMQVYVSYFPTSNRRSRLGAWIEILTVLLYNHERGGRSRLGAWIEIEAIRGMENEDMVAPVWERGLKYTAHSTGGPEPRRSRLGAWIEMSAPSQPG